MSRVFWSRLAKSDLERIYQYISADSEFYAQSLITDIVTSVERLPRFRKLGRQVPEIHRESIREIQVGHYRVIYQLRAEQIAILTVLHGARKLSFRRGK